MTMTYTSLHVRQQLLTEPLTIGTLRTHWMAVRPFWISLEPRAWILERNGQPLIGHLPGLAPLTRTLPEGLDDLPLLGASFHSGRQWNHFHDAHPLSNTPGHLITWSLDALDGGDCVEVACQQQDGQDVLTWCDRGRQRFGLVPDPELPEKLAVKRYMQGGRLIAWRFLLESSTEVGA